MNELRTIQELADEVNRWCAERGLRPANGQAADDLSVRTLRYYRSIGMLDAPASGGGAGYGRRHFLQLVAIRVLQAEGLPLSRIQQLLFGRSDSDLKKVADSIGKIVPEPSRAPTLFPAHPESWTSYPLDETFFLMARGNASLNEAKLEAIRKILTTEENPAIR